MLDAAKPTSRGNGIARTKSEVRASPSYRRCSRERQPIWLRRKLPGWSRRWETVGRRRCLPSGGGRSCCRFMVQATGWQPDWQLNAVLRRSSDQTALRRQGFYRLAGQLWSTARGVGARYRSPSTSWSSIPFRAAARVYLPVVWTRIQADRHYPEHHFRRTARPRSRGAAVVLRRNTNREPGFSSR